MTPFESLLRAEAPLLDAYLRELDAGRAPFTIPGHKRNPMFGRVVAGDVPLHGGLDTVSLSAGVLAEAERRAAALWGADVARFSVGGSTHGNQALALAVGRPGERVVVPRTLHRSLLLGLVLAGLAPVWLPTRVDDASGLPLGPSTPEVAAVLNENPDVVAVFVGDPSYVGTHGDLVGIADVVHARGLPLLVDAAWGAHFGFHPALPAHAVMAGADAMVTSAHKVLPAYSQAAMMLARTDRLDPARLAAGFEATHTTSPAGAVLASIDVARATLQLRGGSLLGDLIELVATARARLAELPGVQVLERAEPAKLVLGLAGTGAHGVAVERDLIAAGVPVELADRDWLIPIVTLADTPSSVGRLVSELGAAIGRHAGQPREALRTARWVVRPETVMPPPRGVFRARHDTADGRCGGPGVGRAGRPLPTRRAGAGTGGAGHRRGGRRPAVRGPRRDPDRLRRRPDTGHAAGGRLRAGRCPAEG